MIYADIGGMSEKADPKVDIPFPAGSAGALADIIRLLVEEDEYQAEAEILSAHARSRLELNAENYGRHRALYVKQAPAMESRGQLAG